MGKIRYNVATSLDGFIASSDGSTNWIIDDKSIDFDALYAQFSVFLMGRKTYEALLHHGNPLQGRKRESIIVASTTLSADENPEITVLSDGVVEFARSLKSTTERDIWLMGGGDLATQLLAAGLVDTIEVGIMPVVIGEGIPMVTGTKAGNGGYKLEVERLERLESGILLVNYNVVQGPETDTAQSSPPPHK